MTGDEDDAVSVAHAERQLFGYSADLFLAHAFREFALNLVAPVVGGLDGSDMEGSVLGGIVGPLEEFFDLFRTGYAQRQFAAYGHEKEKAPASYR